MALPNAMHVDCWYSRPMFRGEDYRRSEQTRLERGGNGMGGGIDIVSCGDTVSGHIHSDAMAVFQGQKRCDPSGS